MKSVNIWFSSYNWAWEASYRDNLTKRARDEILYYTAVTFFQTLERIYDEVNKDYY